MKKLVLSLFFATLAAPSFAQDFTNAKDLVKASYEKTGGDKWKSVHTMTMSSSMTIDAPTGQIFGTAKMSFKYPGYTHVKVLLDIPEDQRILAGISFGYADDTHQTASVRPPRCRIDDLVRFYG